MLTLEGHGLPHELVCAGSSCAELVTAQVDSLTGDEQLDRHDALAECGHLGETARRERSHRHPVLDPFGVCGTDELEGDRLRKKARLCRQRLPGRAVLAQGVLGAVFALR